jgi:hypothetical protein
MDAKKTGYGTDRPLEPNLTEPAVYGWFATSLRDDSMSTTSIEYGFSQAPSLKLIFAYVERIAKAYHSAAAEFSGYGESMWAAFSEKQATVMDAIRGNNIAALRQQLSDPSEHDFFWGYDDLLQTFTRARHKESDQQLQTSANQLYAKLVQVAIAIGALRCPYTEAGQNSPTPHIEELLKGIDGIFCFAVDFPNPYRLSWGLLTSRGVASDRAVQAIYQVWRTSQIAKALGGKKVLEIGAGSGRNAYYARKFGIEDYTIIDVPTTQIAQGSYLGLACEGLVSLHGEEDNNGLRLRSPNWLTNTKETFDVVVNADSLTEMDAGNALKYIEFVREHSKALLSFNHEFNSFTVADLLRKAGLKPLSRCPYWPRAGYVEELTIMPGVVFR